MRLNDELIGLHRSSPPAPVAMSDQDWLLSRADRRQKTTRNFSPEREPEVGL